MGIRVKVEALSQQPHPDGIKERVHSETGGGVQCV